MSKKICCGSVMDLVAVYDDPGGTNHAFNLLFCGLCGMVKKEDVWENAGILEIDVNNKITERKK